MLFLEHLDLANFFFVGLELALLRNVLQKPVGVYFEFVELDLNAATTKGCNGALELTR